MNLELKPTQRLPRTLKISLFSNFGIVQVRMLFKENNRQCLFTTAPTSDCWIDEEHFALWVRDTALELSRSELKRIQTAFNFRTSP